MTTRRHGPMLVLSLGVFSLFAWTARTTDVPPDLKLDAVRAERDGPAAINNVDWLTAVSDALDWLESHQNAAGDWGGARAVRDAAAIADTLAEVRPASPALPRARAWLWNQRPRNHEDLARAAAALAEAELGAAGLIDPLVAGRRAASLDATEPNHPEGGWGVQAGYASDSLDTALALDALAADGRVGGLRVAGRTILADEVKYHQYVLPAGTTSLKVLFPQLSGNIHVRIKLGTPPELTDPYYDLTGPVYLNGLSLAPGTYHIRIDGIDPTTYALKVTFVVGGFDTAAILDAVEYLQAAQNDDGGWGISRGATSDVAISAQVLRTLMTATANFDAAAAIEAGRVYLLGAQRTDGGWGADGSTVYASALALGVLDDLATPPKLPYAAQIYMWYSREDDGSWEQDPYQTALAARLDLTDPGLTTARGDCNNDGIVNAGDLSALTLEFFDGDGAHRATVLGGTYAGNPVGCDANADHWVDAADITCAVMRIFGGTGGLWRALTRAGDRARIGPTHGSRHTTGSPFRQEVPMMRKVLRLIGLAILGVLVIALIGGVAVYIVTERRINQLYTIEVAKVAIPAGAEAAKAIERGKYLSEAITKCAECHGEGLGGQVFVDDPALGRFVPSNLTAGSGGIGGSYTDEDWVRAIRHGVRPDGKPLRFMPAEEYNSLGDEDLGALIAYLKSLPPKDSDLPSTSVGPLGRVLFLAGQLPLVPAELIDHKAERVAVPAQGATKEYGKYLADTGGCVGCHGPGLSGGPIPGGPPDWPPAQNITPNRETGLGTWTIADFEIALRTGKRPDGSAISEAMPWKATAKMSGEDLEALWAYLETVPAKPFGGR